MINNIKIEIKNIFDNSEIVKYSFFGAFAAMILCYTHLLINGCICPDTVYQASFTYINTKWDLSIGRWFLVIIMNLCNLITVPVFSVIVNTICQALVTILLNKLLKIDNKILIFLTAFVLTAAPSVVIHHLYIYMSIIYGIAALTATLFVYFTFEQESVFASVFSVCALVISLGSYQSYVGFAAGLVIITAIVKLRNNEISYIIKKILKCLLLGIIGCILYFAIYKGIVCYYKIEVPNYNGTDAISLYNSFKNIPITVLLAYKTFIKYFSCDIFQGMTFIASIIILGINVSYVIKEKKIKKALLMIALVFLLPLALNIIFVIIPNTEVIVRIVHQMVLIVPFLFALSKQLVLKENIKEFVDAAIIMLIGATCLYFVFKAYITYQRVMLSYNYVDTIVSSAIHRIYNSEEYKKEMKIVPIGAPDETEIIENNPLAHKGYYEINSAIFCDDKELDVIIWPNYLYKHHGVITKYTDEEYLEICNYDFVKEMPIYPDKDSMYISGDKVIIKFGDV